MADDVLDADAEVLQIKKIGNSVGLILPKSLLARLRLEVGDVLHVVDQPERGFKATPYDPKHARALAIARKAFKDYAETFRDLAK